MINKAHLWNCLVNTNLLRRNRTRIPPRISMTHHSCSGRCRRRRAPWCCSPPDTGTPQSDLLNSSTRSEYSMQSKKEVVEYWFFHRKKFLNVIWLKQFMPKLLSFHIILCINFQQWRMDYTKKFLKIISLWLAWLWFLATRLWPLVPNLTD